MRKTEIVIGSIVLGVGVLLIIGVIFNIDIWGLLCPAGLIGLGAWLIYRTRKDPSEGEVKIRFVSDIRRKGVWQAASEEAWGFVLESRLDFREAELPEGETIYRVGAFVNNFKITVPTHLGIAIQSMAFMTDSTINGEKQETFFIPFTWESENYATAAKKITLKTTCFVSEIRVEQVTEAETTGV